jgi:hypothetical protein
MKQKVSKKRAAAADLQLATAKPDKLQHQCFGGSGDFAR